MAPSFRTDWRLMSLLPAASFGLALLLGFLAWYYLMLQVSPYFGNPQLAGSAGVRSALGAVIAGKHMIATTTMLFVAAAGVMVVVGVWTIWEIAGEVRGDDLTDMSRADTFLSIGLIVVLVSIPALIIILGAAQCGATYLFQCMGQGILPDLLDNYAKRLFAADLRPFETLAWAEIVSTRTIGVAGLVLLAAMVMLPRGLEDPVLDAAGQPVPVPLARLKEWFAGRLRRFELMAFVISLTLVAGIAQQSAWMHWPQAIMNEDVLVGGNTVRFLKGNYEALTDSVLQFGAVWYGLMVAALIFSTRAVLARKCRDLAAEIVAYPGTPEPDREAAQTLIDETFAGASPQVYFERYRTYLLALAPAIAQQVL
ncbi:MAG TPA: hypothetical protein VGQ35_12925, partial [Dongiaceae bacterium]|nr:hypothetical protein [Dongiaceae bacterium]